jgi:hypothetical protein
MERRELLKHVGVAAGAGAAGVAGIVAYDRFDEEELPVDDDDEDRETPRPSVPEEYAEQFGTVIDAASSGADASGEEAINDFLDEYADDDTLLTFRPGDYRLDPTVLSGLSTFGILGVGDERPTILPTGSGCRPGEAHVAFETVTDFLLEDVDIDFQENGNGGSIHLFARGDVDVRNVELAGHCPEQIALMRIDIYESEANATVENLVANDDTSNSQLTGVYVGKHHAGSVRFQDCEISGFSDNGLYASSPGQDGGANGAVEVVGGTYTNNNIANVRLGSSESVARGVTIDVDSPPELDGSVNARGIRLRNRSGHVIEDCEISIGEGAGDSFGAIVFHPAAGEAEIRDTRIEIGADDVYGINALSADDGASGPLIEDVTIRGGAEGAYAARLAGRDGTVFRNCTIDQDGHDRGGISLVDADDCRIVDSTITTTGAPIALQRASATIENTTIETPDGSRDVDSLDASNEVVAP